MQDDVAAGMIDRTTAGRAYSENPEHRYCKHEAFNLGYVQAYSIESEAAIFSSIVWERRPCPALKTVACFLRNQVPCRYNFTRAKPTSKRHEGQHDSREK